MLRDLKQTLRILLQTKGWTIVVLLSLALGIGVNAALFSSIDGLLLKTIPVRRPEQLVRLRWTGDNDMSTGSSDYGYSASSSGETVRPTFSYEIYQRLREANETLEGMLACAPDGQVNVIFDKKAELASAFLASGNYFDILGVPAYAGRTILPQDDRPEAPAVAMISYSYWQRRFGGDPRLLGKTLSVNGVPVEIVGITPPTYLGVQQLGSRAADIHLPLMLDERLDQDSGLHKPTIWWLQIVGRLKPGVTPQQVEGNLEGVFQAAARSGWDSFYSGLSEDDKAQPYFQNRTGMPGLDVASAARGIYDTSPYSTRYMAILGLVVVLVLLIVWANVANLLLSRAALRRREISVRLSLGATRRRLIRQLLTESVLLAGMGGSLSMLVAYWSRGLLPAGNPQPLDGRVFLFAGAVSLVTGMAFGILPALRATRVDLCLSLKEGGRSLSRSRTLLSKALLAMQVAVSLVLLVAAGLFLRTLSNLRAVDVGFQTQNVLLVDIDSEVGGYDRQGTRVLYDRLGEAFRAIPGVRAVSLTRLPILGGGSTVSTIHVQGEDQANPHNFFMMAVSPEFFDTLEIPLVLGRPFTRQDDGSAPKVAIINETAARDYFGGGEDANPIGRRFGFSPNNPASHEVVGVIRDTKQNSVREAPRPTVYRPFLQAGMEDGTFLVKTAVEPDSIVPAIREALHGIDPTLPLGSVRTQAEAFDAYFSQERVFARVYSLFGGLALVLACIGLFGLMSYNVVQRTNEIGIRMALGAHSGRVVRMVMGQSMLLVAIGGILGIAGALATGRWLESQLYEVTPSDPATMAAATAILLSVSGIAAYIPARRASRLDPKPALRCE